MKLTRPLLLAIIVLSIILFIITIPLASHLYGYGGHNIKFSLTSILYALSTFFCLKTLKKNQVKLISGIILLLPPLFIFGFMYLQSFLKGTITATNISWLSSCSYFLGFGFGFLFFLFKPIGKILFSIFVILFLFWMHFFGYAFYINYINYHSFTGKILEPSPPFILTDKHANIFKNLDFKNRIVVFEFWFTRCGYCIDEMPKFERLFQRYGRSGKFFLYSVNNPIQSDSIGYAENLVRDFGFSFPLLFADNITVKLFKIKYFPTYLIIRNDTVVFRGSINNLETIIAEIDKPD